MRPRSERGAVRDERGQTTVLIIGFTAVIALLVAVVVDSSAAYLQRQGLDTLADGAALHGADRGATGEEVYRDGVPTGDRDLVLSAGEAQAAVSEYLAAVGATARYPGLTSQVRVTGTRVEVTLSAPLDLPLEVPGAPESPRIAAVGSAVVDPD